MALVEICCGGYEDVTRAVEGNADRIELNSALYMGGLTPAAGTMKLIRRKVNIPIIAMVRPRGGGFCYNDMNKEAMFAEAENLLANGADGIAFGFLTLDKTVDKAATLKMTDLIHEHRMEAVFHMAFDGTEDLFQSMEDLIDCGVDRILTSGGKGRAVLAPEKIKELREKADGRVEILPGGGIRPDNVSEFIARSGADQVHCSCRTWAKDITTECGDVSFSYDVEHKGAYEVVSATAVNRVCEIVHSY